MESVSFCHPTAVISPDACIGKGTRIWQFCTILRGAVIGDDCNLSQNVYVEGRTSIGNRVKIKNNVSIYEGITIDDDAFIGPSAVFTNVINPRSFWPRKDEFKATRVKKGATIGANATIICGVTIGEYAMIGAGSVVTRSVPDYALVYGNPAVQHGWVCYCGTSVALSDVKNKYECPECKRQYSCDEGILKEFGEF